MKKFVSLLLSAVIIASMIPFAVTAANAAETTATAVSDEPVLVPDPTEPDTTVPETTAPETTVPETGIPDVEVKTRGPVRIVDKDEFAGGPPDDPYVSEYLWLEAYCYNDWTTFLYGTMDPDYGVSKQIEDLEHRRLVYFRNGGGAVAAIISRPAYSQNTAVGQFVRRSALLQKMKN